MLRCTSPQEVRVHLLTSMHMWSKSGIEPIISQPDKILQLNISLNEISNLDHDVFMHMKQIRVLDASLNRIVRYSGIEVLTHLRVANLSYNNITKLEGLHGCPKLSELNLAVNHLTDISSLPSLSNLTILNVNNNKLSSLDGIQALAHLRELYAQKNQLTNLFALSSSFHLVSLNAAENNIASLTNTVEVLKGLHRLQSLELSGNPMCKESTYADQVASATNILTLDNIATRQQPMAQSVETGGKVHVVKGAVRQAFLERIGAEKQRMNENVQFLQNRILLLQANCSEFEKKMFRDMDSCMSYLDSLPFEEFRNWKMDSLPARFAGLNIAEGGRAEPPVTDYQGSDWSPIASQKQQTHSEQNTDEVLRRACNKLAQEQVKLKGTR